MVISHQQLLDISPCRFKIVLPIPAQHLFNLPPDAILLSLVNDYLDFRKRYNRAYTERVVDTTNYYAHWRGRHLQIKNYTTQEQLLIRQYVKEIYMLLDAIFTGESQRTWRLDHDNMQYSVAGLALPNDYFADRTLSIKTRMDGIMPQCFLVNTVVHSVKL